MFIAADGRHESLRLQVYVDDPWSVVLGDKRTRDRSIAKLVLIFRILGFPLAFSKGKRGKSLIWIGVLLSVGDSETIAEVTAAKNSELKQLTFELRSSNVVGIKSIRSYVGKAQHIASLIHTWRPFLSNIWGAIADRNSHKDAGCPGGCIWLSQITEDLKWILAFLEGVEGALERRFRIGEYLGRGISITLVTDASPWGIGGWIKVGDKVLEYF
jgi:hypothetical protein